MQNNKPTFTSFDLDISVDVKRGMLQPHAQDQQSRSGQPQTHSVQVQQDAATAVVAEPKQQSYRPQSHFELSVRPKEQPSFELICQPLIQKHPAQQRPEQKYLDQRPSVPKSPVQKPLIQASPIQESSVQESRVSRPSAQTALFQQLSKQPSLGKGSLPIPRVGELLVRNCFVGVGARFDPRVCQRDASYAKSIFPSGLYFEAVGVVEAVGGAVTNFEVGDAVAVSRSSYIHEKHQIVKSALAVKIREATPEALTVLSAGVSAVIGLEQAGDIGTEGTVLITEAGKDVGHLAVQLAKLLGNYVIGTCGTNREERLLRKLGCDRIINYREESIEEVLSLEFPEGIHLVFDCVGKRMFDIGVHHLTRRGRFVVTDFGAESSELPSRLPRPRLYEKLFWRSASVQGFVLSHYHEFIPEACDRLLNLFYSNMLEVCVDPMVFKGIDSMPEATDYLLSGRSCGKVVVRY